MYAKSKAAYDEACRLIPGGVNSPVRAMKSLMHQPLFIERGSGSHVFDVDGNSYIDYVGSWGPLILGHAHPAVLKALGTAAEKGTSFGAPTTRETTMASLLVQALPSLELVRMVNSGTEAVMSALRLARGYTGRRLAVKFTGCYHGHCDSFLIRAGSGAATLGCPDSPGVTEGTAADTLCLPFNNLKAVQEAFAARGEEIAAVVVEPVAGNMGLVLPRPGYLQGLRELTTKHGALLVFDEVITGFRVGYSGAQGYYGVTPDLTALGKVIGGGLPVGAYGGRSDVMEQVAPGGPVYQAGTLSGNPLAMAAGIATLEILGEDGFYSCLEKKTQELLAGLTGAAEENSIEVSTAGIGSLFGLFFAAKRAEDFQTASAADGEAFKVYFRALLQQGVYVAPSPFESGFVSAAHSAEDIKATVEAAKVAFTAVAEFRAARKRAGKRIS